MEQLTICKSCQQNGSGTFCSNCGQPLHFKRISFMSLVHELVHFFTHVDKGILFTVKELVKHPGQMQLDYIRGNRMKHQKPFSMYFICATLIGLILYWINVFLITYYHAGNVNEGFFFHKYMVAFLLFALPFSTIITYCFFYSSKFNFAEIGVMQLYTLSIFFLIIILANSLKLIWHTFETRYIELPLILVYNAITFANFFPGPKWKTVIMSILCCSIFFFAMTYLQDLIVANYLKE